MKIFTILLSLSLLAFIGYLFFSGNVALAIIISIGSLIFVPLAVMVMKSRINFSEVSNDTTALHTGGGASGGVGPSGGC